MKSQERHNLINETYFNESIYLPLGQSISIYACQVALPMQEMQEMWRWKWQPTPVSLSERAHGQRSLVGYSPWSLKESDKTAY